MALILSPEQQAAAAALNPNPTPSVPATLGPSPTAAVPTTAAPSTAAPSDDNMLGAGQDTAAGIPTPAPGTFGSKLGQALDKPENAIPLGLNGKPVPGGWSRSLVGAAQQVLAGLGDVPTGKAPVGGGIMSGIAGTLKNRNERLAAASAQAQKQKMEDAQNTREQQKADDEHKLAQQNITHQNIQFQTQEKLAHQLNVTEPLIAQGTKVVDMLTNPESGHPTPVAARNITSDELKSGVVSGKWNHADYKAYPTSKEVAGEDENGDPVYRSLYTVVKIGGPVTLGDDDADTIKFLNDNHAAEQEIKPGQNLRFDQFNQLYQTASDNFTANEAKKQALVEAGLKTQEEADKMAATTVSPMIMKLLASDPNPINAYNNLLATAQKDPNFAKQAGNIENDFRQFYGVDKDGHSEFDKMMDEYQKNASTGDAALREYQNNPDKMAGDNAAAVVAAADAKIADPNTPPAQKAQWAVIKKQANQTRDITEQDKERLKKVSEGGDVTGDVKLSGPAYLASIPSSGRAVVQEIGNGQMSLTNLAYLTRSESGMKLLASVAQAYPDDGQGGGFDGGKILGYVAARKDFTSGPTSKSLNSVGTALQHLRELYDATTPESFVSGTQAAKDREAALNDAAPELARYLAGGNQPDKEATENAKKSLEAGLFPGSWREGAVKQAKLIYEKMNAYQQQWDNAAPSKAYRTPMPTISPEAKQDAQYLMHRGANVDQNGNPATPAQTTGHKIGDVITQNGHNFTVTGVDSTGKVTGANPAGAQ